MPKEYFLTSGKGRLETHRAPGSRGYEAPGDDIERILREMTNPTTGVVGVYRDRITPKIDLVPTVRNNVKTPSLKEEIKFWQGYLFEKERFTRPEEYDPEAGRNPRKRRAWAETVYLDLKSRLDKYPEERKELIGFDPVLEQGIEWLVSVPGYENHAARLKRDLRRIRKNLGNGDFRAHIERSFGYFKDF